MDEQLNIFETINAWIRDSESSLVNLLSALAPWAAPIAPAYMSWNHMTVELGFPAEVAWAIAAVVEVLGFSAISTIISFWSYNRRRMAEYKKAPVWMAVGSFVAYLAIVMAVNTVLDASKVLALGSWTVSDWVKVGAKGLLVLLSIPAGVILAVRTQHKEMLDAVERDEKEKRAARAYQGSTSYVTTDGGMSRRKAKFHRDLVSGSLQQHFADNGITSPKAMAAEIARQYGTSERSAWRWLKEAKHLVGEVYINENGHGE